MHEIETIAMGKGWSIVRDLGELKLVIMGSFSARATDKRQSVTIDLPPDFATEFFRQKKAIRKAFGEEET